MIAKRQKFKSESVEETYKIARDKIAPNIKKGDVIILDGELGAGKTTFVRGFVEYFGINPDYVSSPTFTLINVYKNVEHCIYHVDFYRILESDDVFFDELMEMQDEGITLIEWGFKFLNDIQENIDGNIFIVKIKRTGETQREILFEKYSDN